MKAELKDRFLLVTRDENDTPVAVVDIDIRPKNAVEFNARRSDYRLSFDTAEEAQKALKKVLSIGDFDKACVWLDKQ